MKVAIVHDYLREYGGAERVVEALYEIFPDAPIYTAYVNFEGLGIHAERIKKWDIRSSWLQNMPFANKLVSPFRIFAPMIFEGFDLKEYDVVISSSAVYFAKAVITSPNSLHIAYIHTPPRYLYGYTTSFNYKKNPITRVLGEIANHFLRIYDYEVSQRPDILVANSENVKKRIKKFYRRDAVVIYPPVETDRFKNKDLRFKKENKYFLSVSRLVRGKGVDITIKACDRLGIPLKVVGAGPELNHLKSLIVNRKSDIEFLGQVADDELVKLYTDAKALILASEDEDFGITPVESMAAGTPVIAPRTGGYLETIVEGKTGMFFGGDRGEVTVDSLVEALEKFDSKKYKPQDCTKQAENFSKEKFKEKMIKLINS